MKYWIIYFLIGYRANACIAQVRTPVLAWNSALESFLKFEETRKQSCENPKWRNTNSPQLRTYLPCFQNTSVLPFFCTLESNVHKRTHIWIKIRTGNDESYRRMIAVPSESR